MTNEKIRGKTSDQVNKKYCSIKSLNIYTEKKKQESKQRKRNIRKNNRKRDNKDRQKS